jgi:hypothetical protein
MSEEQIPAPVDERTFELSSPLIVDGKEIKSLSLDFRKLKGSDYKALESQYRMRYPKDYNALAPSIDLRFREMVIARLNKIVPDSLGELDLEDYAGLQQKAFNFLGNRV